MFGTVRKLVFMIVLGYRYIHIFKKTYLSEKFSEAEKQKILSVDRQRYSNRVLKFLNMEIDLKGHIPDFNQALYIFNHRSLLDIIVIESVLARKNKSAFWIAKQELIDRFYGKFFLYSGCVGVDIDNKKGLFTFFKRIKHNLAQAEDTNLIIAPEGERFKGEGITKFQGGAETIARSNNLTVVPLFINDKLEIVFSKAPFKSPYTVEVFIGEPITTNRIEEEYTEFMNKSLGIAGN